MHDRHARAPPQVPGRLMERWAVAAKRGTCGMEPAAARTLGDLAAMRDAILARIVEKAATDERVVAAWLTGSFGRGEDDAWSDLDLHFAIEDAHLDAWWLARESLYS